MLKKGIDILRVSVDDIGEVSKTLYILLDKDIHIDSDVFAK